MFVSHEWLTSKTAIMSAGRPAKGSGFIAKVGLAVIQYRMSIVVLGDTICQQTINKCATTTLRPAASKVSCAPVNRPITSFCCAIQFIVGRPIAHQRIYFVLRFKCRNVVVTDLSVSNAFINYWMVESNYWSNKTQYIVNIYNWGKVTMDSSRKMAFHGPGWRISQS